MNIDRGFQSNKSANINIGPQRSNVNIPHLLVLYIIHKIQIQSHYKSLKKNRYKQSDLIKGTHIGLHVLPQNEQHLPIQKSIYLET